MQPSPKNSRLVDFGLELDPFAASLSRRFRAISFLLSRLLLEVAKYGGGISSTVPEPVNRCLVEHPKSRVKPPGFSVRVRSSHNALSPVVLLAL
jgi:hypothetical protein